MIYYLSITYHNMREITIQIKDEDYLKFQTIANESVLKIDEKISEIIQYYIIIERNRKKFSKQLKIMPES